MEGKRKARAIALIAAAVAALAMASCQLAGVTQGVQADGSAESRLLAASQAATTTIYCTASLPPECFFFEFDLDGAHKTARVLLPQNSEGYVQDGGLLRYRAVEYPILKLAYNKQKGRISGFTAASMGVSYSFSGDYSKEQGFSGSITRIEDGVSTSGLLTGVPIAAGSGYSNYVGQATYQFPTPTPQTLIFNVAFNPDAGEAYGTWCESGIGWPFSVHGSMSGSGDSTGISFTAIPVIDPIGYLQGDMSALGLATFKDPTMQDAAGTFTISYLGMQLPSLLTATKEVR